ncbi:MAG TPA: sugar transferase [Steroidobacteraceae bacterium]|jgi:lipopolysaccharide/colanic/teichoic acid biosynthesis glycosyltransferase
MKSYPGKRALDVLVAGTACAAFAPLVAGVAVATWLEDNGSPLFAQRRVGRERRPFTILKLRSMREQRVTRVGRWLRRTGLDELPQFVNVLRGEMSMVGPRPLTQQDVNRLGWHDAPHDWRFAASPGITGLSQLLAQPTPRSARRLDRLYLQRQSLLLDLRIIALSFAVNVAGKRNVRHWVRRHPYRHVQAEWSRER